MSRKFYVSDDFIKCYTLFNVINIINEINKLTSVERKLLFLISIETFSEESNIVISNFGPYVDDLDMINELQVTGKTDDSDLLFLINQTNDDYIDTTIIVDKNANKLSEPLSDNEAKELRRNINIDNIFNS